MQACRQNSAGMEMIIASRSAWRLLDGVWKDEWEFETPLWSCVPLYWRKMYIDDVKRAGYSPATQLSLF